ncbi:MAG: DoxX family protein [Bacteroidales bacterium]|jgi:uncharacterized membrane protein YphA (DoxX/SURF4 family)|nr:DoxX family protein [Bacteroidales bacterium]
MNSTFKNILINKIGYIRIFSILAGIIFLLSGIGKSMAVLNFYNLIIQYGFSYISFLAPFIVLIEILLGLFLVFQIRLKETALVALLLLFGFTSIYSYGYFFQHIEDCGCFGAIPLTLPPIWVFIRNIILMVFLFFVFIKADKGKVKIKNWVKVVVLFVMCCVSFTSGYTYTNELDIDDRTDEYLGKSVQETVMKEFITTSKDSSYLIFAFSYSCSHCLNSIENLKQYEPSGAVDKVIGLAWGDSIAERQMKENFNPNFLLKNYSPIILFNLTNRYPTAYYIKNDTIKQVYRGELPCSYIFSKKIKEHNNKISKVVAK